VFFFVVKPMNYLQSARAQEDPDTKECPECTSAIPVAARRCPQCTARAARASHNNAHWLRLALRSSHLADPVVELLPAVIQPHD
jgi:predicted amidophosphoribosyltransferase